MPAEPNRTSLPLQALLEAINVWAAAPDRQPFDAVCAAVDRVVSELGATGASVRLDAPPLPRLELTVGVQEGARERIDLLLDDGSSESGMLQTFGDPAPRAAAARALELAIRLAWARIEARLAADRVTALDEATRAIATEIDLDRVLQQIVDQVRPLVGARYAALGVVGPGRRLTSFITSGVTAEQRRRIGALPEGHGLLGLIIREARSIRVEDIDTDPHRYGFPPNHPEMHSFLGVPVMVQGVSVGNLYLTEKEGLAAFTIGDQRLVETFAVHAGIAIERARLHDQVQRLAIVDERERISRDLHDGVIQSLYAVSLSLEDIPELVDHDRDQAMARIDRAIDDLHATIRDVRNFIVGLRPEVLSGGEIAEALGRLADEARERGIEDVRLEVEEDTRVSALQATDVIQAAREAVSNAVRHSGAGHLAIRLHRADHFLVLEVEDDGHGFDPTAARSADHHGLENMRSRARGLQGDAVVDSAPGQGTRVTIRIATDASSPETG
jgi:signal transduction histidine kinase